MFLMKRLAVAALAVAVLMSGALHAQAQDVPAQLGEPFELAFGEQARFASENVVVAFSDVVQDSRCPSDVVCIWEGQATIGVLVQVGGINPKVLSLTIGADESPSAAVGQYMVRLVSLEPYPQSSVQTEIKDYVATLVVTKVSANSEGVFVRAADRGTAVVAGWNLERESGTLVMLVRGGDSTQMSVARFVPVAAECTVPDASECIEGQVVQATGTIVQGTTIHLEVAGGRLVISEDGAHSLEIRKLRTFGD